jgi:hypothetical protein
MEPVAYFELNFKPNVALVSVVRRFVMEFYQRFLSDPDGTSRVALATHELLENAVAYASDGETGVRVELLDDELVVRTWNKIAPDRLEALAKLFAEMNSIEPEEYYRTMLKKTAYRTDGSGLGLARVRAEAEMAVTYELDDGRVCVQATAPLKKGGSK